MRKVLIADDEPKIRHGLRKLINWSELGLELVGEAEDGEMALELAKATQPDILLVDICMPFLNGLQFIEQIKTVLANCQVIVITGHDEFVYAQQAIKLQVFDYLLKPVAHDQLLSVLQKACQTITEARSYEKYVTWADRETKKNFPLLRETFCREWINNPVSESYVNEQLSFLDLTLAPASRMIVLKATGLLVEPSYPMRKWEHDSLLLEIQRLTEELLVTWQPSIVFSDKTAHIVAIVPMRSPIQDNELIVYLQQALDKLLKRVIIISQKPLENLSSAVSATYRELLMEIKKRSLHTPAIVRTLRFIETNYYREELSLHDVAQEIKISPAYLSRLLKSEVGISFVEYLTRCRVQQAMQLMGDSTIRMQEVAQRVGYSNQHYFSTIFKKVTGISPGEYRKRRVPNCV